MIISIEETPVEYPNFDWIPFYKEFADKLLTYKKRRRALMNLLRQHNSSFKRSNATSNLIPFQDSELSLHPDADPFTVIAYFTRQFAPERRTLVTKLYGDSLGVNSPLPTDFNSIPIANHQQVLFCYQNNLIDVQKLWTLFDTAMNFAATPSDKNRHRFCKAFESVDFSWLKTIKTKGLFWIRPDCYLCLDGKSLSYLRSGKFIPVQEIKHIANLSKPLTGEQYLALIDLCKTYFDKPDSTIRSFPELVYVSRAQKTAAAEDEENDNEQLFDEVTTAYDGGPEPYTRKDFLDEVFLTNRDYETLTELLRHKKNLILQGAPGVGKTYTAKRLAYAFMGSKDNARIQAVQFHQSYSYEDFIMGYRPTETGFALEHGAFYEFCKKAQLAPEHPHFFIIDEINRGNLSKILGELMMLIEHDKRGTDHQIRLLYANELFSVPANIYIIGMMNTADRSLAMIDYALRRRFAFFDMHPGFNSEGFDQMRGTVNNPKFDKLVRTVQELNNAITQDDALGTGFCVGHSFLCVNDPVDDTWLECKINYELIPLLQEYWFDNNEKVDTWSKSLRAIL